MASLFRGFPAQRNVSFLSENTIRQEKKHDSDCQEIYANLQAVSDVFKG